MTELTLRSRAVVMTVAVAWLPYITMRCIDPASCPAEHARQYSVHHDRADHGHGHDHGGAPAEPGTHDEAPAPSAPARACCDLTGKFNVIATAGAPSVAPVLFAALLAAPLDSEGIRHESLRREFVAHVAHGPPGYIRNHTLLL